MKQIIIGFLFACQLCTANLPSLGDRCKLNGDEGLAACALFSDCDVGKDLYINHGQLPQPCTHHKGDLVVCCAGVTPYSESLAKCQEYSANVTCNIGPLSELIGNRLISTKNYPHVAKLLYKMDATNKTMFYGNEGTLISARYVLTAALSLNGYPGYTKLVKVRLGMADLLANERSRIDYGIEKTIAHPNYHSGEIYNDIALIKLSAKVEFSEYIRPICLPDTDTKATDVYRIYFNFKYVNSTQHPLVKYQRWLVSNEVCNVAYKRFDEFFQMDDNLICTTSMELGDSIYPSSIIGAPIVTSHPSVACANSLFGISTIRLQSKIADAAIKVFNYIEWIEFIIWADGEE